MDNNESKEQTTALEVVSPEPDSPAAFEQRLGQFWRLAEGLVKSGLAPKGMNRPEQAMIAMQTGHELGLAPMTAVRSFAVVNGKPTLMGEPALGLLRVRKALKDGTDLTTEYGGEGDDYGCTAQLWGNGQHEPFRYRFTVAMAKQANLWGRTGPWTDYPDRMLMWRAVGFLLKDHFSHILLGVPLEAEVLDIPRVEALRRPRRLLELAEPVEGGVDPILQLAAEEGVLPDPVPIVVTTGTETPEDRSGATIAVSSEPVSVDEAFGDQGARSDNPHASYAGEPAQDVPDSVAIENAKAALRDAAARSAKKDEPERDPETGEVIPDSVRPDGQGKLL